ncbi:MAG: hypothetical protein IJC58_01530, partial [Oscillospiraceae bacterium]|nr:hypothetical protein [Oscillospiraceae bacterium]
EEKKEENAVKLYKYILSKGDRITPDDIATKCLHVCLPQERSMPSHAYVRYMGDTTEKLVNGSVYLVSMSYDNDRSYLVVDETKGKNVYPGKYFEKMDVSKIRYRGYEADDGSIKAGPGFAIGETYAVREFKGSTYTCEDGFRCETDEADAIDFIPARPRELPPFSHKDDALHCLRYAVEFGQYSHLENRLSPACEYLSQDSGLTLTGPEDIISYMKKAAARQMEKDIFLSCSFATVTKSAEGNRYGVGERCLAIHSGEHLIALAFAENTQSQIHGIYLLKEPYEFEMDPLK